ncbi:type VI secretion system-associated protein VasI [Marinobacter santoriniensis]|nr:type VI secretion system-associated protein VasI [Marinobacter santoriniensis]
MPRHLLVSSLLALIFVLPASADQLEEAHACVQKADRLDRLACFDRVFGTPLLAHSTVAIPRSNQPERWRQAFAQASQGDTAIYRDTGQAAGLLVTVPALGVKPPRPLLVLQCQNNITELSVMLPRALDAERVRVVIGNQGATSWRVRGGGFVVSGGRGLPAIRTAKAMLAEPDVRVNAQRSELDGLVFDLTGFGETIRPVRSACGW